MPFLDINGLTTSQAELLACLQEYAAEKPETWFLFVNGGFTVADAKALYDRGMIEAAQQMGMPAARMNTWIAHDGGDCPVDAETKVHVKWRGEDEPGVTTHRASAFNWKMIAAYKVACAVNPSQDRK